MKSVERPPKRLGGMSPLESTSPRLTPCSTTPVTANVRAGGKKAIADEVLPSTIVKRWEPTQTSGKRCSPNATTPGDTAAHSAPSALHSPPPTAAVRGDNVAADPMDEWDWMLRRSQDRPHAAADPPDTSPGDGTPDIPKLVSKFSRDDRKMHMLLHEIAQTIHASGVTTTPNNIHEANASGTPTAPSSTRREKHETPIGEATDPLWKLIAAVHSNSHAQRESPFPLTATPPPPISSSLPPKKGNSASKHVHIDPSAPALFTSRQARVDTFAATKGPSAAKPSTGKINLTVEELMKFSKQGSRKIQRSVGSAFSEGDTTPAESTSRASHDGNYFSPKREVRFRN